MEQPQKSGFGRSLLIAIGVTLALIVAWHVLIIPLLGASLAITSAAWALGVWIIVALVILMLLFFILPLIGVFVLAILASVGVIMSIVLFPILFPILIPVWMVCLFLAHCRRKRYKEIHFD